MEKSEFCPPVGEYMLKEKKFEKKEEGFTMYAMCDSPEMSFEICACDECVCVRRYSVVKLKVKSWSSSKQEKYIQRKMISMETRIVNFALRKT